MGIIYTVTYLEHWGQSWLPNLIGAPQRHTLKAVLRIGPMRLYSVLETLSGPDFKGPSGVAKLPGQTPKPKGICCSCFVLGTAGFSDKE